MNNEPSPGTTREHPSTIATEALRTLVDVSADGLVLLDDRGHVRWSNDSARQALGTDHADVDLSALLEGVDGLDPRGPGEEIRGATWLTPGGRRRHLNYRALTLADGSTAVWLSDVTEHVRQQERIAAITRAAASVADTYSLRATLDAVAQEIARTAGIAAVQIHAYDDPQAEVRLLGMAGFGDAADFTRRLAACRRLGARMLSIESFTRRERVVSPHRKAAILSDPMWEPLHEIMARPDWDTFVAVPLRVRGRMLGAVNAYYQPGEDPGPASLSFLEAMADHVAMAMDTANLLHHTQARARSDERRRLARDLHDSAVQQVFSMRLQAEALRAQLVGTDVDPARVRDSADELAGLATNALADLRALLLEMRPFDLAQGGLVDAVRASAVGIEARHGLVAEILVSPRFDDDIDVGLQEDLFRVVQEALHNVVKHAGATRVSVCFLRADDDRNLVVEVVDDGSATSRSGGSHDTSGGGLGLVSMRERAESWGGRVEAGPQPDGGWTVRAVVPVAPCRESP